MRRGSTFERRLAHRGTRVYLSGESEPVAAGRGNAIVDWGFNFDVADPDAYRFELEWISQDTPIRDIRIEFVDYYEAPGKHLGSVEWKVD